MTREIEELAIDLCAAYIAHKMGISPAWARKKYVERGGPVGQYWLTLAALVIEHMHARMDALVRPHEQGSRMMM